MIRSDPLAHYFSQACHTSLWHPTRRCFLQFFSQSDQRQDRQKLLLLTAVGRSYNVFTCVDTSALKLQPQARSHITISLWLALRLTHEKVQYAAETTHCMFFLPNCIFQATTLKTQQTLFRKASHHKTSPTSSKYILHCSKKLFFKFFPPKMNQDMMKASISGSTGSGWS